MDWTLRMPLRMCMGPQKSTPVRAKGRSMVTQARGRGAINGACSVGLAL